MEAYLQAFVNFEQNDWARLLPIAKFTYNNVKNTSIGRRTFELNYDYYLHVFFEEDTDLCFWLKRADKLLTKLKKLMIICWKNLHHAQKL